jgi:hypothetical protein
MKDLPDYFYQINSYSILASTPEQRPILANYSSALGYECDLDFNVFDVNFGTSNDISSNDPFRKNGSPLLNRLNGLNQYAQTKANNLLEFADSNYTYKKNMSIHVGGFPARP